tara:strand:- start:201 stop:395 length:195 start_codon:yes stop_codon:yes gene_type:complete
VAAVLVFLVLAEHQKLVEQDLILVDLQQVVLLEVVMVVLLLVVVEVVDLQSQTDLPQEWVVLES